MIVTDVNQAKKAKISAKTTEKPPQTAALDPVATALKVSVPAWPLQNTVAVNPFWHQRARHFSEAMEELAPILHTGLYMPLSYYLEKYRAGGITVQAIEEALEDARAKLQSVPDTTEDFLQMSHVDAEEARHVMSGAEFVDQRFGSAWRDLMVSEIGKFAAAYFDRSQATVKFPWRNLPFWQAWLKAQKYDLAMEESGIGGFSELIQGLSNLDSAQLTQRILKELDLKDAEASSQYLSRLLALTFGWSTQFSYVGWQKGLGYSVDSAAQTVDLLAVVLSYDYAILKYGMGLDPQLASAFRASLMGGLSPQKSSLHPYQLREIWQSAFEKAYQAQVASQIRPKAGDVVRPKFQLAMCIDVRSEMYRRALESVAPGGVTIGFAGFFGVPFDYHRVDEEGPGHRLPVLLSPAFKVHEEMPAEQQKKLRNSAYLKAYFRNLRKAPHASLFFVEVFGLYSVGRMVRRFGESLLARPVTGAVPARFCDHGRKPSQKAEDVAGQNALDLTARTERAAAVLRHMGLRKQFARLVVLAGHGSVNANNAFTSSLDCGACGGHAGDINARFLADLLNDPLVRVGLSDAGLRIPEDTWFVAAVHETVTDQLYLLDEHKVPKTHAADVEAFRKQADLAGERTRQERQWARSRYLDPSPARRSINWSEVRPEWGLAGNASFIVAPRHWTRGANLASRSFLHDYDWRQDEGFKTLELIMTAPMLVTNWINLQYYASTVAPSIYGAGNKVIHNLVNETGVLEGNGGDLRVGLPWQSVHDGERFVHEPLRLSVYIAAPRDEIEQIIAKHAVVRELVDNEWLFLLHIDEESGAVTRRAPGGLYLPVGTAPFPS